MCDHHFHQSKKSNVLYCSKCFCLSYKKKTLLSISSNLIKSFSMDPLLLKFKPNKYIIDRRNNYTITYLNSRKYAINFLKIESEFFSFPKEIFHKALNYIDNIYLHNNISINIIEKICSVCLFYSVQFNDCYLFKNNKSDLERFNSYIKNKKFENIKSLCIKCLNYDLGKYSILDYINLFFSLGLFYKENNSNICNIYYSCINYLDTIIEDNNSLEFSSYITAITIIKKILEIYNCLDYEIFDEIYGIQLFKKKYILCENNLNIILSLHQLLNNNNLKKDDNLTVKNSKESTKDNSINDGI